jgi:transketolase
VTHDNSRESNQGERSEPARRAGWIDDARELAAQLRVDSLRCSTAAGSGHPTSSLSAADLMAVLVQKHLRWKLRPSEHPNSDQLVFSKGHASPLLYSLLKAVGAVSDVELLSYRRFGSGLPGHPVPGIPGVSVATGSLGQGLPAAVGLALSAKRLERLSYRVWVLLGDSEMSEGSIWEAFDHARHYALGNLVAVLDMNRLGQRGETPLGWNSPVYAERARAFGWRTIEIDGHDLLEIDRAYEKAVGGGDAPTFIVARTLKGKGVPLVENQPGWHGKALDEAQCRKAVAELGGERHRVIEPPPPPDERPRKLETMGPLDLPVYDRSKPIATRKAFGDALRALGGSREDLVVLDAEVSNSTYAGEFAQAHPDRYFEMFIAEQQMIGTAVGLSVRGHVVFSSTFAAFLTRAYDFIRMAAVSRADLRLSGSHAGVSIGEDGPSQMGLEDLAMMRAVHGSTVLYPCCANQTAKLVCAMASQKGISYLRTTRGNTPVLYDARTDFPIGGSKKLRESDDDEATVIAAGITVHEALEAYQRLLADGLRVRVLDAYSVKPIDDDAICAAVSATSGRVVVVEDHFPEGGLGDAVFACFARNGLIASRTAHLAVRNMPGSGAPAELLREARIDADAIVDAVRELLTGATAGSTAPRAGAGYCYACGRPATFRIVLGAEDEVGVEEDACDEHAKGQHRLGRLDAPHESWRSARAGE